MRAIVERSQVSGRKTSRPGASWAPLPPAPTRRRIKPALVTIRRELSQGGTRRHARGDRVRRKFFLFCFSCNDGEAARLMLIPAPRIDYKSLLVVGALVRGIARYV